MDQLENYVDTNALSRKAVLKYVDDYSLYSFYIGEELELYTKYSSPLRDGDDDPSFSMYYSKYRPDIILFKDNATGQYGDVFKFLELYLETSPRNVLLQINSDLQLGLNNTEKGDFVPKIIKKSPLKKSPVNIKVTLKEHQSKEFDKYWMELGIPQAICDMYYARDVDVIHYIYDDAHLTVSANTLTISYEILGHYKIYQPYAERKYKFRNNYLETYVEGALQLKFHLPFCIITKSTKECMFFRAHFDWDTVAGKSENTMIPKHFMNNVLRKMYKIVYIFLDNDEAGRRAQARYMEEYPWLVPVVFDEGIEDSDPTDFYLSAPNKKDAIIYLKSLINNQ